MSPSDDRVVMLLRTPEDTSIAGAQVGRLPCAGASAGTSIPRSGSGDAGEAGFAGGLAAGLGVTDPNRRPARVLTHRDGGPVLSACVALDRLDLADLDPLALDDVVDAPGVAPASLVEALRACASSR